MNILVCVKRVPLTGGKIALTSDEQDVDTRMLGFTISPHEECAVEEAVRLVEKHGGSGTVLTLGPPDAVEQLRDAMALGMDRALFLETDGRELDPMTTAQAIVRAIQADSVAYDVLFFGNEAADSGGYQVGIRVAHTLDLPCVTGLKALEIQDGKAQAKRETPNGWETFEVTLPAVFTLKEGINLPRYPSLPGRLKAKKKPIDSTPTAFAVGGLEKLRLKLPEERAKQVEILGNGPDAAPRVVEILRQLGLVRQGD